MVQIDKTQSDSKHRICRKRKESTNQVLSDHSTLLEKEYKYRHDCVGKRAYLDVSRVCEPLSVAVRNSNTIPSENGTRPKALQKQDGE